MKPVYLITGATGYIGSMLAKHLLNNKNDSELIIPFRDRRKIREQRLSHICSFPGRIKLFEVNLGDSHAVDRICSKTARIDYILHCASITDSLEMETHPVEVTASIVNVTQNVLELARRCKIKSMVYLSSMEVYGSVECPDGCNAEEWEAGNGRVDILNKRSCYPLGKRMAENICYSYFKEYGIPVKIARLAQTFGRGIRPSDRRVFAEFARAVQSGKDIILHTDGASMGNYCSIDDAIEGILSILVHGQDGEAYNVVNEKNTMTIRQMAELVSSKIAGNEIGVRYDIPQDDRYGYAANTGLRLSGKKLKSLGWQPKKDLEDMYREMLDDIEEKKSENEWR